MVTNFPQKIEALKSKAFRQSIRNRITCTTIPGLKSYELPVVGTYVHSHILPSIKYRVRLGGTNEYLFDGKALKLESIGQGYGKRITFESDNILENNNFFWSDSHEAGFAFSPEILSGDEEFQVMDSLSGTRVGTFTVKSVKQEQQITDVTLTKADLVCIHADVTVRGELRLMSQNDNQDDKDMHLVGDAVVKLDSFSCTLEFLKTENGVVENGLYFIKYFK